MKLTSEVYKKLYHYTTLQGAYEILKAKSLWATHYKFLNDYSEITLFRNKFIEFLHPHVLEEIEKLAKNSSDIGKFIKEKGGASVITQHETAAIVDSKYSALGDEIYITSFCGEHKDDPYINENGLLSQWRGYGKDGGIALVFKTQELENMFQMEGEKFDYSAGVFADLIYSDDEQKFKSELSGALSNIAGYARELLTSMALGKEEPPDATKAYPSFVECISRYKHRGFKEENEVRIVVLPVVHNEKYLELVKENGGNLKLEKERQFRDKSGEKIPYIELFGWPDHSLPIERIIVGPHKEKEARAAALKTKLRNTDIEISISNIPYTE
ncbi:MAG: DUF2971 domain-containing protein [Alphaproteobacteria bacterium]|nr:DUF2971 domain-containing protein [Alphaproteobacteria bacterium]